VSTHHASDAAVQFARNGDVQIAFVEWEPSVESAELAEPLLLVAGLGGGRGAYPPGFIQALIETGFRVVSYDHRDVGASTRFTDAPTARNPFKGVLGAGAAAYSMEDMTDDAVAVLDAVGWSRAHLVGQSMGGLIAQRIALRHPDRVKSLASISAMPSDAGRLAGLRYLHLGFIRATSSLRFPDTPEGDLQTAMAVAKLCASPGYPWDEAATLEWLRQVPTDGVRDSGAQARQMRATWHGPRLKDISAPTLILHGDRDPVVRPTAARAIAGQVAGSEVDILPGVGHDLPQPLYAALAARIRANATRATSPD
jgi:pimeloyl-ACP methyl ester carboxylesterase